MLRSASLLLIILFACNTGTGQSLNKAKLDSFLNVLASRDLSMGSITISRNGAIEYQKVMGYSMIFNDRKILAKPDTWYRIGSVTKMFTAVMILELVEEGGLLLNQTLGEFFPKLPNAAKITIGNLLYHRSGLHDYTDGTNFEDWMDKPKSHAELLKIVTQKGADFEPNKKAAYSNTNFLLLGYIIEKLCHSSYESALKKRILSKLNLQHTFYGKTSGGDPENSSASYKYDNGSWKSVRQTDMDIHHGAGSVVSTPADLTVFLDALFSYQLISKRSLTGMKTMIDGFGMGLFPYDHSTHQGFGHNGRIEEFYTAVRYFPTEKLSVAYCTNGILYPRNDILEAVLKICFNEAFELPFSKNLSGLPANLDQYAGTFASTEPPITVRSFIENGRLKLETRGKTFEVEPVARNYFMHLPSGSFFEFIPEKGQLRIKETDNSYDLKKE